MAATTGNNTFLQRLIGAAALDPAIYEEVEGDRGATGQALIVVALSGAAAGIGARGFGAHTLASLAFFSMVALVGWAAWALVTYEIGVRILPEPQTRADVGELLRTIGFAATPGLLRVFGVLPAVAIPAFAISAVWMLASMIVAVRHALDYKHTSRAIAVCVLGWALAIVFAIVVGLAFGPVVS